MFLFWLRWVFLQVLKEIGELGHITPEQALVEKSLQEEEEKDEGEEDRMTVSVLKKKKRLLTSFQNSFFSGCTPIREEP